MTQEALAGLIGLVLPILISVLLSANLAHWVKRLVVVGISIVIGFAMEVASAGGLGVLLEAETVDDLFITIATIIGAAQLAYATFFKPTGLADNIEKNVNLR